MTRRMIRILQPGAQSLVVDRGRPGQRHRGVPGGGAADRLSFQLLNWIAGNAAEAGALECAGGGLRLEADADAVIATGGAGADATLDGQPVPPWRAHTMRAGQTLRVGPVRTGARVYVAFQGGIEGERDFGSLSTYPLARLGANGGRALRPGDTLRLGTPKAEPNTLPAGFAPRTSSHLVLRVRSVGEYAHLSAEAQRRLFTAPWEVASADRMGARLAGGTLDLSDTTPLVSSPLPPGTLQVPPDGAPILSLADGHCTGGYKRALQVIAPDMWVLGQVGPGTRVSFARAFASDVPSITRTHLAQWRTLVPDYTL